MREREVSILGKNKQTIPKLLLEIKNYDYECYLPWNYAKKKC